jgi:hypothetical protein
MKRSTIAVTADKIIPTLCDVRAVAIAEVAAVRTIPASEMRFL